MAALGTYLSLISTTNARAQASTFALLFLTNWAYLFCCMPLRLDFSPLMLAGITPVIEVVSLASYQDVSKALSSPVTSREIEGVLTGLLSLALYGVAALMLTLRAIFTFDDKIGRPSRGLVRSSASVKGADGEETL